MSIIAGIDPGKSGAIVILKDGKIIHKSLLSQIIPKFYLQQNGVKIVWCEKAQVMGKESARSMFNYGRDYGYMLGTLNGCGFDINFIHPAIWTKELHKKSPTSFDNPKVTSLYVARQIWPDVDMRANDRCRVPHDGIVDAALIAYYGWLQEK
jgi:hypothetical protein